MSSHNDWIDPLYINELLTDAETVFGLSENSAPMFESSFLQEKRIQKHLVQVFKVRFVNFSQCQKD